MPFFLPTSLTQITYIYNKNRPLQLPQGGGIAIRVTTPSLTGRVGVGLGFWVGEELSFIIPKIPDFAHVVNSCISLSPPVRIL